MTTYATAPVLVAAPRPRTSRARGALGGTVRLVGRSIAIFVPVFLLGSFVTFALRQASGLSPARIQLGENATPEAVARVESEFGLDRPFLSQYLSWLKGALHGDLGRSWSTGAQVSTLVGDGITITLSVATLALVIGAVVGFGLGTLAAVRRTTWVDRAITGVLTVFSVMPPFVVGILLVNAFAVSLRWFPAGGYVPLDAGVAPWFVHLLLPALALSLDVIADVARQLRAGLIGAYQENYVTGALVRGLSPRRVFIHHVLRNGAGPAIGALGYRFPILIGGSVVTEFIFGLQGFGRFANDSAQAGDVPSVQGVLLVSIVLVVLFNLVINLVLGRVTPASQRGV